MAEVGADTNTNVLHKNEADEQNATENPTENVEKEIISSINEDILKKRSEKNSIRHCSLCSFTYTFRQTYLKHWLFNHEAIPERFMFDNCVQCKRCESYFEDNASLTSHQRRWCLKKAVSVSKRDSNGATKRLTSKLNNQAVEKTNEFLLDNLANEYSLKFRNTRNSSTDQPECDKTLSAPIIAKTFENNVSLTSCQKQYNYLRFEKADHSVSVNNRDANGTTKRLSSKLKNPAVGITNELLLDNLANEYSLKFRNTRNSSTEVRECDKTLSTPIIVKTFSIGDSEKLFDASDCGHDLLDERKSGNIIQDIKLPKNSQSFILAEESSVSVINLDDCGISNNYATKSVVLRENDKLGKNLAGLDEMTDKRKLNSRRILCRLCCTSVDKTNYTRHFKFSHPGCSFDEMYDDGWKCSLCSSVYNNFNSLRRHWTRKHNDLYDEAEFSKFMKHELSTS